MIKYDKFFELMNDKGYTAIVVKREKLISQGTYYAMKHGTAVIKTDTIDKLCKLLDCQPNDIMEYVPDEEANRT